MTLPVVVAVVPAEDLLQSLVQDDRRYTLHRVVYDLYSRVFPARIAALVVNVVFCGGIGEYQARLVVTAPDGQVVAESPFTFKAQTFHIQAVNLGGTLLPTAGQYTLTVELEGQPQMAAPLTVADLGASGKGAA